MPQKFLQLDGDPACHGATGCSHVTAGRCEGRVWNSLTSLQWLQCLWSIREVGRCRHANVYTFTIESSWRTYMTNNKIDFPLQTHSGMIVCNLNSSVTLGGFLQQVSYLFQRGSRSVMQCNIILCCVTMPQWDMYNHAHKHKITQIRFKYVYHLEFDGRFGYQDKYMQKRIVSIYSAISRTKCVLVFNVMFHSLKPKNTGNRNGWWKPCHCPGVYSDLGYPCVDGLDDSAQTLIRQRSSGAWDIRRKT